MPSTTDFRKQLRPTASNPRLFISLVSRLASQIHQDKFPALLRTINSYFRHQGRDILLSKRRPTWTDLSPRRLARTLLSPSREFAWHVFQLKDLIGNIALHLELQEKLSHAVIAERYDVALSVLDQHVAVNGASLWNLEARIACTSRLGSDGELIQGLLQELHVAAPGSLAYLLATIFADYYDHDTTLGGSRARVEELLTRFTHDVLVGFLSAKFLEPRGHDDLAALLGVMARFSVVDAYEACIQVLNLAQVNFPEDSVTLEMMRLMKVSLGNSPDIRVQGMMRLLVNEVAERSQKQNHCLFDGVFALSGAAYPDLVAPIARTHDCEVGSDTVIQPTSAIETAFASAIRDICDERSDVGDVFGGLLTTISKHAFLPWAPYAEAFAHGLVFPLASDNSFLRFCATHSPVCCLSDQNAKGESLDSIDAIPEFLAGCHPWAQISMQIDPNHSAFKDALAALIQGNPQGTLVQINAAGNVNAITKYGLQMLHVEALTQLSRRDALAKCVQLALTRLSIHRYLPFFELVGDEVAFSEFCDCDLADLVIGLFFLASKKGNAKAQFNLEMACKQLLRSHDCSRLADLASMYPADDDRIPFILKEVFVPANLRFVGFLTSVDDLENSRLEICRVLLDRYKVDVEPIVSEIADVLRRRRLREAQQAIETSRINVNQPAIRKWAEDTYREQFLRIRNGRVSPIAPTPQEIRIAMDNLLESPATPRAESLERNFRDPLFVIGSTIFSRCFTKEEWGLEHYLSLRIRHGSLTGYLRAPLERARLLEQGTIAPGSPITAYWNNTLATSGSCAISGLLEALSVLQRDFDQIIEDLRSNYIQVTSTQKPSGLFQAGFPKIVWDAFHSDWERAETFDALFDSVWSAFVVQLQNCLLLVQQHIDSVLLPTIEMLLNRLRETVGGIGLSHTDYAFVVSAINDATLGAQEAIRVVKQWFVYNEQTDEIDPLDFDQVVDVALNVFRNARPTTTIELSRKFSIEDHLRFARPMVQRITDALFILLDNIYRHSGIRSRIPVDLVACWNSETDSTGILEVQMSNPLGPEVDLPCLSSKLRAIASSISDGHSEGLAKEGGSGLIKVARIAGGPNPSSSPPPVEFVCTDTHRFVVTVRFSLSFTVQSVPGV